MRRWKRPAPRAGVIEAQTYAARSHVGTVREINEDRLLARSEAGLWAVVDGMGGHIGGGQAADKVVSELARLTDETASLTELAIREALAKANSSIRATNRVSGNISGATAVVAWIDGGVLSILWAGDSRAYLHEGGSWRQLTRDHSVVQELVDLGEITEAQAGRHPQAHVVTRALGAEDELFLEHVAVRCQGSVRLLLCSDGVSRTLDMTDIGAGVSVADFADRILGLALERDGSDNATLIAVDFGNGSDRADELQA